MSISTGYFNKTWGANWLLAAMIGLSLAGLGVSLYLMWGYTAPGASLACGGSGGCDAVKNSVYASLLGIPLPTLGLISYVSLLALLLVHNHPIVSKNGWTAYMALLIFGLSLVGVLYSAYLTYLELFVIYAICHWCVASAVIMVGIFFLSIFNLRNTNQSFVTEG
jgi:uncharacterized membrane protein